MTAKFDELERARVVRQARSLRPKTRAEVEAEEREDELERYRRLFPWLDSSR